MVIETFGAQYGKLVAASSQRFSAGSSSMTSIFTLEGWFFPKSFASTNRLWIGDGGGTTYNLFNWNLEAAGMSFANGSTSKVDNGPRLVNLNEWTHLAITMDGSNTRFFINGRLNSTIAGVSAPQLTATVASIGGHSTIGGFIDGGVQLFRRWSVARSEQQIWENKCLRLGTQTGLVNEWPLNGSLLDNTATGNNLSAINSAGFAAGFPPLCLLQASQ